MDTLIERLVASANFVQLEPLAKENASDDVLHGFFTCWLAMMADSRLARFYEHYVADTATEAATAMQMGAMMPSTAEFLTMHHHDLIAKSLAEDNFVSEASVSVVLPLAVHHGISELAKLASAKYKIDGQAMTLSQIAHEHYEATRKQLPAWAGILPQGALNPVQLSDENTQYPSHQNLSEHTNPAQMATEPSVPMVDVVIGDDFVEFDASDTTSGRDDAPLTPLAQGVIDPTDAALANEAISQDAFAEPINAGRVMMPRRKRGLHPAMFAIPLGLLVALGGGAYYVIKQKNTSADPVPSSLGAVAPTVTGKPASRLNITVGENGTLYACQAELGSQALQSNLMGVLNSSFNSATCVLDVNDSFSAEMQGMDKLASIVALLKSARYASLEMTDNQLWIHAPNTGDVDRLVSDIGALLQGSGIKVAAMPPYDRAAMVAASLKKAESALDALPAGSSGFALARAMSLPIIDFTNGLEIPVVNQSLLARAAEHLKANPSAKLIVAAHISSTGDDTQALIQSQQRADAVRAYLIGQGVDGSQLVAQGVGTRFPVADNETELGRFKNNRVEFLDYHEDLMRSLSPPVAPPVQMGNQQLDQGGVYYSAPQEPAPQDPAAMAMHGVPPMTQEMNYGYQPAPTYEVQNGQIVQQGQSLQMAPSPMPSQPSPISDDLLNEIGADPAGAPAAQIR